jgi:predicted dehydrogenase
MGRLYARAFHDSDVSELVSVVDIDTDRARVAASEFSEVTAYNSTAEMLAADNIDAAAVSLPDYAHRDTVVALLDAGVPVLCEKPLATTLEDCADIGQLQSITMKGNEKLAKTRQLAWRDRTDPTWFLISHLVDFVSWLTGERFSDVCGLAHGGQGATPLSDEIGPLPLQTGHTYIASLDSGTAVTLSANWALPAGAPAAGDMAIEIIGSKGYAKVDFMERPVVVYGERADHLGWDLARPDYSGRSRGWWITSCDYFLDCVANRRRPEPSAEDGAETSLVLLAMHDSLDSGVRVRLDPIRASFAELIEKRASA